MPPVFPSDRGIAATIGDIDASSDEAQLRAGMERGLAAVAAELRAHTPAPALAAAWSEVLRHGLATAVDLKLAIDPVVKIARWAVLATGSDALSTLARLDAAAAARVLDADDVSSLRDCIAWLLRFRWRTRAGAFLDGRRVSDVVSLSETPPQERAMLRSVAREVSGISRELTYLASTSAFR
jgi:signal-transduction protein with cAMP-binding, CBS, and nucleotidyltransferase domain